MPKVVVSRGLIITLAGDIYGNLIGAEILIDRPASKESEVCQCFKGTSRCVCETLGRATYASGLNVLSAGRRENNPSVLSKIRAVKARNVMEINFDAPRSNLKSVELNERARSFSRKKTNPSPAQRGWSA